MNIQLRLRSSISWRRLVGMTVIVARLGSGRKASAETPSELRCRTIGSGALNPSFCNELSAFSAGFTWFRFVETLNPRGSAYWTGRPPWRLDDCASQTRTPDRSRKAGVRLNRRMLSHEYIDSYTVNDHRRLVKAI
jgi:hypothetical protein